MMLGHNSETAADMLEIFGRLLPQITEYPVRPLDAGEKVNAVFDITRRIGAELSDVIYFGDSIVDIKALDKVREAGGITVSFNGDRRALEHAEIACVSPNYR